jgi:hypothetical protein
MTTGSDPQTYGDLKQLIEAERNDLVELGARGDWTSRVNKGMTHSQVLDVLAAGLATHPDDLVLGNTRHGRLYKRNVLRECRSRR